METSLKTGGNYCRDEDAGEEIKGARSSREEAWQEDLFQCTPRIVERRCSAPGVGRKQRDRMLKDLCFFI